MRLYQLLPNLPEQFAAIRCKCDKWTPLKEAMADLDAPFGTYYCEHCLRKFRGGVATPLSD